MSTTANEITTHPLHLRVGPYTLVSAVSRKGTYHTDRWAVPGCLVMDTYTLQQLAATNGWAQPYPVSKTPLSSNKLKHPVGVSDEEVGRLNRGVTAREARPSSYAKEALLRG